MERDNQDKEPTTVDELIDSLNKQNSKLIENSKLKIDAIVAKIEKRKSNE